MGLAARAVFVAVLATALIAPSLSPRPGDATAVADDGGKKRKKKKKKSVPKKDVFLGKHNAFETPAEVDVSKVYAEIEEYKTILEKKLEPEEAEYSILLSKASSRFRKAVRKAAKAGGYDLVARLGSVKGVDDVPDISQDVIDEL